MREAPSPYLSGIPANSPAKAKSYIDILAEIDDWYIKELTTMDSWNIPEELLNAESRREIRKIAFLYGIKESVLLAMVTPFIYGVLNGWLNPLPEAPSIGKAMAVFVLGWPYVLLCLLPAMFALKVRGTITECLCRNAHVCRGLGLVAGTWSLALTTTTLNHYAPWLFGDKLSLYFPNLDYTIFYLFPASWFWLIAGGVISAVVPAILAIYFPVRAKSKWQEIQELMRGLEA